MSMNHTFWHFYQLWVIEYMPSTNVDFIKTLQFISDALNAAAVSVVKYGFPVPAAKITTLFFSKCL